MKLLFHLGHPAHYHLFINSINIFKSKNVDIYITFKRKDVLEDLLSRQDLRNFNIDFGQRNKSGFLHIMKKFLPRLKKLYMIVKDFEPNLLIGSAAEITHIGRLLGIPSLIFFEDDLSEVKPWKYLTAPFSNTLICPSVCEVGRWKYKTIKYDGYHELAYLSESYFFPDEVKVNNIFSKGSKNIILRLSQLNAYHDVGKSGLIDDIARKLIEIIKVYGNVFITSERPLIPDFERYRINLDPYDIHHALYYADLYIGDSQTMAAEAAVLGTPSLRFNDFVGKLGYLEELEHKYGLTFGIKTTEPDKLYAKVEELIKTPNLKREWLKRRKKMLADKIDVTAFMVWFIENYPESVTTMKENPDFQERFL